MKKYFFLQLLFLFCIALQQMNAQKVQGKSSSKVKSDTTNKSNMVSKMAQMNMQIRTNNNSNSTNRMRSNPQGDTAKQFQTLSNASRAKGVAKVGLGVAGIKDNTQDQTQRSSKNVNPQTQQSNTKPQPDKNTIDKYDSAFLKTKTIKRKG